MNVTVQEEQIREAWKDHFNFVDDEIFRASTQPDGERILVLDYFDLTKHSVVGDLFRDEPNRVYGIGQEVLDQHTDEDTPRITLAIENAGEAFEKPVEHVSDLQPGTLVEFRGMVRHQTKREKRTQVQASECLRCHHTTYRQHPYSLTGKKQNEQEGCPQCEKSTNWRTVEEKSLIESQKVITVTPVQGSDSANEDIRVLLHRDLVNQLRGGDEVIVTGFTAMEKKQKNRNLYTPFVVATQAKPTDRREVTDTATQDDVRAWKRLAQDPEFLDNLIDTVFPHYHGQETGRKAMLLSMFSSPRKGNTRGDVNLLLIGSPGTGKSQLLRQLDRIAPRSLLTNAKTSTSVGLTAAAVRDDATGMWTLQSGALPLASGGLCVVDEIDKASKDQMDSLLEALEDQTISVDKAGMNTQLTAECSVIAAGNPKHGRWDPNAPIIDQIDITPPLISRFDAILLFQDSNDEERLEAIADAVTARHTQSDEDTLVIDPDLVTRMAWFCRENVTVEMTPEATGIIKDAFLDIRKNSGELGISPRQMESMVRFAKALARVHLRNEVTEHDAQWAVDFVMGWIKKVAGQGNLVDIDRLADPEKASQRQYADAIREVLAELMESVGEGEPGVHKDALFNELREQGFKDKSKAGSVVRMMKQEGEVMSPRMNYFKLV